MAEVKIIEVEVPQPDKKLVVYNNIGGEIAFKDVPKVTKNGLLMTLIIDGKEYPFCVNKKEYSLTLRKTTNGDYYLKAVGYCYKSGNEIIVSTSNPIGEGGY